MIRSTAIVLSLVLSMSAYAAGTLNDPLDGTGLSNNPNSSYATLFGSICSQTLPANDNSAGGASARIFNASLGGQGDEGFSIAFGTTFDCDPSDPSVGLSQEQVDSDPVGQER